MSRPSTPKTYTSTIAEALGRQARVNTDLAAIDLRKLPLHMRAPIKAAREAGNDVAHSLQSALLAEAAAS